MAVPCPVKEPTPPTPELPPEAGTFFNGMRGAEHGSHRAHQLPPKNRSVVMSPHDLLECVAARKPFDIFRFRSVSHPAWLRAQHSPANSFKWRSGLRSGASSAGDGAAAAGKAWQAPSWSECHFCSLGGSIFEEFFVCFSF